MNTLKGYEKEGELIYVIYKCLNQNYSRFNNKFHIQKKGLPMGLSVSEGLLMAEIYTNNFKNKVKVTSSIKTKSRNG